MRSWKGLLLATLCTHTLAAVTCPPLTPDLPLVQGVLGTAAIANAGTNFTNSIETFLSTGVALDNKSTSFIVDVYSLRDNASIFTYSFDAPALQNASEGVSKVTSDTIFRLGSISKVFTVYTFLKNVGDFSWNDPITKYVPELRGQAEATRDEGDVNAVRWEDVTVGSLAAQLSGTARASTSDAQLDTEIQRLTGLPPVPAVNTSFCPPNSANAQPCDRQAFFQNEFLEHPIVAPDYQPVYSNNAYQILAYALESITNSSFVSLLNETFATLNMTSSSYLAPPTLENAIVPFNDSISQFSQNVYTLGPGGGLYSTINDLRAFGLSVLASAQLPPTLTRRWLKPLSFTPDRYLAVGAPWQIYPYPASARYPTQIYAKGGNLGLYSSEIGLVPDYGIGFSVLAAGLGYSTDQRTLADLILQSFMPAIQGLATQQSNARYAGSYTDPTSNSSVVLSIEDNDRGSANLVIDSLSVGGKDFLAGLANIQGIDRSQLLVELYYTGLSQLNGTSVVESWRLRQGTKNNSPAMAAALAELGAISNSCEGWQGLDTLTYGAVGYDEVLFSINESTGRASGINVRAIERGFWNLAASNA